MELREPLLDASDPLLEARDPRLLLEDTVRELADRLQKQEQMRFRDDRGTAENRNGHFEARARAAPPQLCVKVRGDASGLLQLPQQHSPLLLLQDPVTRCTGAWCDP